jgi:CheY-like chemotaxis protein
MSFELSGFDFLVVDDNAFIRTLVKNLLRSNGAREVRQAEDGTEAWRYLADHTTDMVVCDLEMEPMNGVEFTRRIRTKTPPNDGRGYTRLPNPATPIIMLTSHSDIVKVKAATEAGIDAYVVKPIVPAVLLDRILRVMEKRGVQKRE